MPAPDRGPALQDHYPDHFAHCYGCGRLNDHGHHVRTFRDGDDTVAEFQPKPWHVALPGFVYGGLIASLIDCHGIGTASDATLRAQGSHIGAVPSPRFVTASLHVDYLKPTPLGPVLELRGTVREVSGRRITVDVTLAAGGVMTARGTVVAVAMPEAMAPRP